MFWRIWGEPEQQSWQIAMGHKGDIAFVSTAAAESKQTFPN